MSDEHSQSDHDLLIELRTDVRGLRTDVKSIKEGVEGRLAKLEAEVDSLKTWRAITVGAVSVMVTLLIPLLVYIWQTSRSIDAAVQRGVAAALAPQTED